MLSEGRPASTARAVGRRSSFGLCRYMREATANHFGSVVLSEQLLPGPACNVILEQGDTEHVTLTEHARFRDGALVVGRRWLYEDCYLRANVVGI